MTYWNSIDDKKQSMLRNLQLAEEEQWKHEMLMKYKQSCLDNEEFPVNDVVEEHAVYFAKCLDTYISETSDVQNRTPDWVVQLQTIGSQSMAFVIIKVMFDLSIRQILSDSADNHLNKYNLPKAQDMARAVSSQVIMLKKWFAAKDEEPEFFRYQTKFFKNWDNRRRKAFIKKVDAWNAPSLAMQDKFGHAMLRLAAAYDIIKLVPVQERGNKSKRMTLHVQLNEQLLEYLHTRSEGFIHSLQPNRRPMICKPVDWTSEEYGGFMDFTLRGTSRISYRDENSTTPSVGDPQYMSDTTLKVINTLQASEWRINPVVAETMKWLWENEEAFGSAPSSSTSPRTTDPNKPDKTEDPQAYAKWIQARQDEWARWYRTENSRIQHMLRLKEATRLGKMVFWHAYFCDFRGRFYSDSYLIHPQGGDLDKSLLKAAAPIEVTDTGLYWIKVNLANLFGVDKISFDARVKWCDSQMEIWRAVVEDPIVNREMYEDDAPKKNATFQRLAAIFDLIKAIDEGLSEVPVQIDGSCNGIQHWAALTRDETIGPEVNLCSHPRPRDVYQLVADECTEMLQVTDDHGWHDKFLAHYVDKETGEPRIPRKVCKRSVMCDPYGISSWAVTKYVLTEGHMAWAEKDEQRHAAEAMGRLICSAKDHAMQHCNNGKEFVKAIANWVFQETKKPFSWITPSGFEVINYYHKVETHPAGVRIWHKDFNLKATNHKLNFGIYTDEHDPRAAVTAMSPNFVHSLDASHMSLVVDRLSDMGIEFFSMIHDSFGVMANYVPMLRDVTKETFHEIHQQDQLQVLLDRAEELAGRPVPSGHHARGYLAKRGSLDIADVLESEYLFG